MKFINLKYLLLILIFVVVGIGIIAILFNQFDNSSENSFFDDLQAGIFGTSVQSGYGGTSITKSQEVDFKLNLKEGEIFNYSETFEVCCGNNLMLNSSYKVIKKEYNNLTECYTIQYWREYINSSRMNAEEWFGRYSCVCNFTIATDNDNLSLCAGKREPMFYDEKPFFGIVNENFTVTSEALHTYEYRYGLYKGEGNITLKAEIKVVGKENINGRNVYVINRTSENLNLGGKTPKVEIKTISQIFVDADKGIVVKRIYYNDGNKIREIQLINL